jgi:tetratricopeptide (TPR) repeat protein
MKNLGVLIFLLCVSFASASDGIAPPPAVEKAKQLLSAETPAKALATLANYTPSSSELSSYHYLYAKAFDGLQKPLDAIPHLALAYLYADERGERENLLLERAETYQKMGYYQEASLCYKSFLREFQNSPRRKKVYLRLAHVLLRLGQLQDALIYYEKTGDSIEALFGKANTLHDMGRTAEAHNLYSSLITRDQGYAGTSQETMYRIGENMRLLGKSQDARIYLNLIREPSIQYRAKRALALIALEESHPDEAIKLLKESLHSPERALRRQALLSLSNAYLRKGRQDEAISLLLEIRNNYPYGKEYDAAMVILSGLYGKEGKYDEALTLLKELVYRKTPVGEALDEFERIIMNAMEKDHERFLTLWSSVGHWLLDPSRIPSLMRIAEGLRGTGKPYLEVCDWLSRYGSGYAKVHSRVALAGFYAGLGDADRASLYLKEIKGFDESDEVLRIHSRVFMLRGASREAAESLLSIKQKKVEDLISLAPLLHYTRNPDTAFDSFGKELEKRDVRAEVYLLFADTLYDQGKKEQSEKFYRLFVSMENKEKVSAADDMAWALYRISILSGSGQTAGTLESLRKTRTLLSRFTEARSKDENLSDAMKRLL